MTLIYEKDIYEKWVINNIFQKTITQDNEYIFFDGPPFSTGNPHVGHYGNKYIKDTVLRYHAQLNKKIPRRATWDTHGLPIEYEIDKLFGIKTPKQVEEFGIGNYNQECKNIVMRCADFWKKEVSRAGIWLDFDNDAKTMDFDYMNSVWWGFNEMYNKKLIYKSYKILPYSLACKTPLSNFETQQNYQKIIDETLYVKFKLNDRYLLVWTTTPWTLPSNIAIAINKNIIYSIVEYDNEEYIIAEKLVKNVFSKKKGDYKIISTLIGESLINLKYTPLFNCLNNIPTYIIIHGDFVKDTDGTGIVHIAPSYGEDDYNVCIINNIIDKKDKLFMTIDENGYFVNNLLGLEELNSIYYKNYPKNKEILDGNTIIINKLKINNMIFSLFNYEHNYPFCWRSDTPLMYRAIENWFINVESIKTRMVVLNKKINWVPANVGTERFNNWLLEAKDWCIGRNRYWGTPIPIWENIEDEDDHIVISSSYELEKICNLEKNIITDIHRDKIDHIIIEKDNKKYKRVNFVMDCWLESGSMPFALHGYPFKTDKINITADFISEGIDQTRGWFYTLLVVSTAIFDVEPFKNVIVNGLILASDGKKMSKRLKNYTDISVLIDTYGSDSLRLYLLNSPITKANTLKFNDTNVKDMNNIIIIHIINVLKFYIEYKTKFDLENPNTELYNISNYSTSNPLDIYIIKQTKTLIDEIRKNINDFLLSEAIKTFILFVDILSNQYIKFNRTNIKGKKHKNWISSLSTIYIVLNYATIQLASLMPFTAEYIYQKINNTDDSVHLVDINSIKLPELLDYQIIISDNITILIYIIKQIYTLKSKNNINLFSYHDKIIIKSSNEIIDILNIYLEFILDEGKVLNIDMIPYNISDIEIILTPNFNKIKEIYPNNIIDIKNIINNINDNNIKCKLYNNESIFISTFKIDKELINIIIEPKKICKTISEYSFYNKENYCIYLYIDETEDTKILNYSCLIAKHFQLMRKNQGLHTWDKIFLGVSCNIFKVLSDTVYKVCDHIPIYFDEKSELFNIIKKDKFNDIYLYLLKH